MFDVLLDELTREPYWTVWGFVGQAVFGGRFVLQWLVSDDRLLRYDMTVPGHRIPPLRSKASSHAVFIEVSV